MKHKIDAYEQEEQPQYTRRVKVITPNGQEAVMVYSQLCDAQGNLEQNVTKIESGYYRINKQ